MAIISIPPPEILGSDMSSMGLSGVSGVLDLDLVPVEAALAAPAAFFLSRLSLDFDYTRRGKREVRANIMITAQHKILIHTKPETFIPSSVEILSESIFSSSVIFAAIYYLL